MIKSMIIVVMSILLISGCQSETTPSSAPSTSSSTLTSLTTIMPIVTTREKTNEGLKLSFTENQGKDWFTTILPTKQLWENAIDKQHLFASLNVTGSSWVMLRSTS